MILNQLLKNIKPVCIKGDTDIDITGVNIDSRKIREQVIVSPLGIAVENGNAFVIVAREDDPRLEEIFSE